MILKNGAALVLCGAQKSPMKHLHSIMEVGTQNSKPNQGAAVTIVKEFVVIYGAPAYLHTYHGRNFEPTFVKEICRLLGVVKSRTTPYHPRSNGMIERFNRTLLSMLKMVSNEDEHDWNKNLPCLMMAYRTFLHETTRLHHSLLCLDEKCNYTLT